jgi:hypothetical protein
MFYTPRHVVLAALHVDDCGIDYHKEDTEIVDKIVTEFKKEWKVTDADPRKFLGFDLRFEKEGLFLCADTAEQESAEKWGLMRSNPKKAPTPSGAEPPIGCERDEEVDPRTILAAAGEFGYPGHVCRPDILVPLQMLRVAVSTPSQGALKWIQHLRQYSVGGQAQANPTCRGLFFKYAKTESNEFWCNGVEFKHILYTDASYHNCPTKMKSTLGGFMLYSKVVQPGKDRALDESFLGNCMLFGSRWLPNTPTSTHESEMLMLAKGAISSLGVTSVAEDLGIPAEPLLARCDNSAVVIVGKTGVHKEASRLCWIRYWVLRDLLELGHIRLEHVATETNVANWLTKVLPGTAFVKERDRVMTTRPRIMKPTLD